jgi:hypothetical protein
MRYAVKVAQIGWKTNANRLAVEDPKPRDVWKI